VRGTNIVPYTHRQTAVHELSDCMDPVRIEDDIVNARAESDSGKRLITYIHRNVQQEKLFQEPILRSSPKNWLSHQRSQRATKTSISLKLYTYMYVSLPKCFDTWSKVRPGSGSG
jgi:hypothetical protein